MRAGLACPESSVRHVRRYESTVTQRSDIVSTHGWVSMSEGVSTVFANRQDAGEQLARLLTTYQDDPTVMVLGIPRGGVIVAERVARALGAPLDVAVSAKVGAPGNPEYAVGAVAADGEVVVNPTAGYSAREVAALSGAAFEKVHRQLALWREGRQSFDLTGRTALLVDDGLATGLTARATLGWLHRQGAAKVVLAVPVAPPDTIAALRKDADEVVVVDVPSGFSAVGQFYRDFGQTSDEEVRAALGSR